MFPVMYCRPSMFAGSQGENHPNQYNIHEQESKEYYTNHSHIKSK